jgi:Pin2-interacting protein X1
MTDCQADSNRRTKISHDPNNTSWTRSTTTFGHRMLTAQGWTPGSYLGPQDAAHAEFHTAANASFIRVALRDDNLGLGAKSRGERPDDFGLEGLNGLLGRLNGKDDDELEKERSGRQMLRTKMVLEGRWGMKFVSGGVLGGDGKIKKEEDIDLEMSTIVKEETTDESEELKEENSESAFLSKEENTSTMSKEQRKALRRARKQEEKEAERLRKSLKKQRKKERSNRAEELTELRVKSEDTSEAEYSAIKTEISSTEAKEEKNGEESLLDVASKKSKKEKKRRKLKLELDGDIPAPVAQLAAIKIQTAPHPKGRQLIRQRNILQKRMATLDTKAMNEVSLC